jgi:hypothetical protein
VYSAVAADLFRKGSVQRASSSIVAFISLVLSNSDSALRSNTVVEAAACCRLVESNLIDVLYMDGTASPG